MTDLFLIAIKSRGEAAFDIAEKLPCPECSRQVPDLLAPQVIYTAIKMDGCAECDGLGFWWITTAGYRAYPFRTWDMDDIYDGSDYDAPKPMSMLDTMPEDAIDLFPAKKPIPLSSSGKSLLQSLGLLPKVVRRL